MADYVTLQDAVDGLRADNQALTDEVLAGNTTATTAKADAEAARDAAELAETNAKQSEILSLQYKDSAEAAVPLAEQHKLDAEAQVPLAQAEKTAAEAARDSAVLTALGPNNDKLASIASVYSQPSLNLDFAKQSFWKQGTYPWNQESLDPAVDLTFTRASTATYFDANGVLQTAAPDEMRFDHDPVTGEPLGVLIEPTRTNWVSNNTSFSLDHPNFSSVDDTDPVMGSVVRVTAVAAGENSSGERISTSGYPIPDESLDASPGLLRVIYAKPVTADYVSLRFASGPGGLTVKLSTAEVVQRRAASRFYVKALAGGWVQIAFYQTSAATTNSAGTSYLLLIGSNPKDVTNGQGIEYAVGDEVLLAYPSMYQAVPEGPPQSIIPTAGARVTRAADSLRSPFAEEYNPKEGTWVWEGLWTPGQDQDFFRRVVSSNNMWGLGTRDGANNGFYYTHRTAGAGPNPTTNRFFINDTLGTTPRRIVVAGVYKAGEVGEGVNRIAVGGLAQTWVGRVPEIPADSGLLQDASINPGEVGSVRYFPYAMTEAELIELTALPEEPES